MIICSATVAQASSTEPGLLLKEGVWNGGIGSFTVPAALAGRKPDTWPGDQWFRLKPGERTVEVDAVVAPPSARPAFLGNIAQQLAAPEDWAEQERVSAANYNVYYLRVPGTSLRTGAAPAYRFRNGTPRLRPILDHRYELTLGTQAFAFTVRNGLRGRNGEAYGSGAQYTIEFDGKTFEYSLGEFGWDSQVIAIADLDGDGKPDFVISVGGNNSGYEAILLSSVAKPGANPATASLRSVGC